MEYNFDNERPIYIQLVEMLKIEIISGRIKSAEKLLFGKRFRNESKGKSQYYAKGAFGA